MKKLLLIVAVMALLSSVFAQTYLFENFETGFIGTPGAPPGWTQTRNRPVIHATNERDWLRNTRTAGVWSTVSVGTNPTGAVSGTGVLWIDDANFMGLPTPLASRRMESPVIDLSASTSPYLRFWYFNAQEPGVTLNLRAMVSRDGGASWDNLMPIVNGFTGAVNTWNRISIAIPAFWRTANTRIALEITNRLGGNNPFIDDVSVEEFTPTWIQSAGSGEWNSAATWVGGVIPTADNHVEIRAGHTVNVTNATGIIARCQRLVVHGTLTHGAGTANLLHAYSHIWVHGTLNAFNDTSGRTVYCGGDFRIFSGGRADFSVGTTAQAAMPFVFTIGASQLVVLGAGDAVFENGGTLVNARINNFAMLKPSNFTLLQPVTVPFTFGLYSGNVLHTGGNLILGNAPATGTVQNIVYHHGGLGGVDPVWNNLNIPSRHYTLFSPNWVPLRQSTVHSNDIHFELVGGVRTVTNTLTMNTHNNLLMNSPVTVGTADIGGFTLSRGIIDTGGHVLHLAQGNATTAIGTLPSTATPSTTHGSYVVGLVKRTFPASGTHTRQFPLGLGTAFNGLAPNANVRKHVTIATGTNGSSGQSPIVSIVSAPSGMVNAPLTATMGNFAYRVNRDGGTDFTTAATITLRSRNYTFGGGVHSDGLVGMIDQMRIAQSTALTGAWTERSVAVGANTPIEDNVTYERTTFALAASGPIAPLATRGEFFGWGTTRPADPGFGILPNEVTFDFGSVRINTPVTRQYTITNTGVGTLNIPSIGITGNAFYEITANPAPVGLSSGQSAILVVRYLPTAVGAHYAQLTITHSLGQHVIAFSGTCFDPTISAFPHLESFDGTAFAPLGWTNNRTAGTDTPGIWDRQTAGTNPACSPYSGAGMARYNSFDIAAGGRAELITPPINLPDDDYQVQFWMYRDTGISGRADLVNVYYSTTNSSVGGILLGTINRSTTLAPVVPSAGWYEYTFNMPVGAGGNGRFIIFEAVSAFGNNMFIDHVLIRAIPVVPQFVITPNEVTFNFGNVIINTPVTRQYSITNTGGGPLDIQSIGITGSAFYEITANPAPVLLGAGESAIFIVRYRPTAVGSHNAQLTITHSQGTHVIDFSGTCFDPTISAFPHLESFDGPTFAPFGWTNIRTAGAPPGVWDRQTAGTFPTCSPYSGAGMARYNSYLILAGGRSELITPPLNLPNANYQVIFRMYRDTGYPDRADLVNVYFNTTNSSVGGTLLGTINRSTILTPVVPSEGWYEYTFDMPAGAGGNGRFIIFEGVSAFGNNIFIDQVQIRAIPPAPLFMITPNEVTFNFGNVIINVPVTRHYTITNDGGGTLNIQSIGITGNTFYGITTNPAPVLLGAGESAIVVVRYLPTAVGTHNAQLTITHSLGTHVIGFSGTCFDPSISTFPHLESFDDPTFALYGWTNIRTAGTSTPGIWDRRTTGTYPICSPLSGAGMARYKSYTIESGGRAELITPPLNLPNANYQVIFWMYRDTGYPDHADLVNVYYNTINSSVGGTLLGTINRSTVLTPVVPSEGWYQYTFNMPAGAGGNGRFIIFEGVTARGNDIFIDHVQIRAIPVSPVFEIIHNDVTFNFGNVRINTPVTRQYTITNTGIGTLNIQSIGITGSAFYGITTNPAPVALAAGQSAIFIVRYLPTAVGTHNAQLTITHSQGTHVIAFSGNCFDPTISAFPHLQSFDGLVFAPFHWTNVRTSGTTIPGNWDRQTAGTNPTCSPYSGAGMARYNSFDIAAGGRAELITPPLNLPNDDYQVRFWMYRDTGFSDRADRVNVYYNTTHSSVGGTLLGTIHRNTTLAPVVPSEGWYEYTFNMPVGAGGNGRFIIFEAVSASGNNIFIDHVQVRAMVVGRPGPPTLVYPTAGLTGLPKTGFNFQWTRAPTGAAPTSYNLYIADTNLDVAGGLYEQHVFPGIVGTSFNPVTQGGMTFNHLERWYWTVEAVNVDGTAVAAPRAFVIEADSRLPLPYEHSFPTIDWPDGWTQSFSGGVTSNRWNVNDGSLAGGAPFEMRADFVSGIGISRLITPPFNTTGVSGLQVKFRHFFDDFGVGVTARVMTSHDLITWTPTNWQIVSGGGNVGPRLVTINIPVSHPTTYIAWVLDGDHWQLDYWYVDEVNVSAARANDVAVTGILGMPHTQLLNTTYNPQAIVANMGVNTQTFDVTMTIGSMYSSTRQVNALAFDGTATVDFAPWIPGTPGHYNVTVTTQVAGDQDPANDSMTQPISVWETIWVNEANIPVVSILGSAASYIDGDGQGNIITSGGSSTLFTEVQRYNAYTNTWTALTNIPDTRVGHASAIVNGYLYIIGGAATDGVLHYTVHRYDIAGNTWTTMAPMPEALIWIKAVSYNDTHIYVAGGWDHATAMSSVYVYDIAANTWSVASPMPGPKFDGAFAITGNTLVYVGGRNDMVIFNTVYVGVINPLSPASITWTTSSVTYPGVRVSYQPVGGIHTALDASPVKTQFSNTVYPAGGMFLFDGATWGDDAIIVAGGSPSADWLPADPGKAYSYTPATDIWTELPNLNVPVMAGYFTAVQSSPGTWKAVMASGFTGTDITPTTQTLTMVTGVLTPDTPTNVTINTGPVLGQVSINWDSMPNATWYGVYGGTDPYNLVYLGHVTNNMVTFTADNMGFFRITAGAGAPVAPLLP